MDDLPEEWPVPDEEEDEAEEHAAVRAELADRFVSVQCSHRVLSFTNLRLCRYADSLRRVSSLRLETRQLASQLRHYEVFSFYRCAPIRI